MYIALLWLFLMLIFGIFVLYKLVYVVCMMLKRRAWKWGFLAQLLLFPTDQPRPTGFLLNSYLTCVFVPKLAVTEAAVQTQFLVLWGRDHPHPLVASYILMGACVKKLGWDGQIHGDLFFVLSSTKLISE